MRFLETVIATLIIVLCVFFMAFRALCFIPQKDNKQRVNGGVRTRPTKFQTGFFIGFGIFALLVGAALTVCIFLTGGQHFTPLVISLIWVCAAVISCLCFFACVSMHLNYLFADENGVLVHRLFGKKKFYRYGEIGAFKDTTSDSFGGSVSGSLTGYGLNGKKIFSAEAILTGTAEVVRLLREHGVAEKDKSQTDDKNRVK